MEKQLTEKYREILHNLAEEMNQSDTLGRDAQDTVTLDQQSVGRLSRMDALQQQAMAKANQTRRNLMKHRITAALGRLDRGEFGYCSDCGSEISPKRLELDPTAPLCIECASS